MGPSFGGPRVWDGARSRHAARRLRSAAGSRRGDQRRRLFRDGAWGADRMMSANTRRGKSQRLSGRGVLVLCYHTGPAGGPSRDPAPKGPWNPSAWGGVASRPGPQTPRAFCFCPTLPLSFAMSLFYSMACPTVSPEPHAPCCAPRTCPRPRPACFGEPADGRGGSCARRDGSLKISDNNWLAPLHMSRKGKVVPWSPFPGRSFPKTQLAFRPCLSTLPRRLPRPPVNALYPQPQVQREQVLRSF